MAFMTQFKKNSRVKKVTAGKNTYKLSVAPTKEVPIPL